MEMGAPKTIKATVGRAESSSVTVYWRDTRLLAGWIQIQLLMKPDRHSHSQQSGLFTRTLYIKPDRKTPRSYHSHVLKIHTA